MIRVTAICLAAVTLAACGHRMTAETAQFEGTRRELAQNYTLGKTQKAVIGTPIIRLKDFIVESTTVPVVNPTEDVTISGPVISPLVFSTRYNYRVRGRIEIDGTPYLVVPMAQFAALVRPDGTLHNRVLNGVGIDNIMLIYTFTVTPATARMIRQTEHRIVPAGGYVNYEIAYTGMTSDALQLTYREFGPDGLPSSSTLQTLTYPKSADVIRFKQFRIKVFRADSEEIEYSVLEDGR
jgi:hypothetical protein